MKKRTRNSDKLVLGVGRLDVDYPVMVRRKDGVREECPYYRTWHSMMRRCYGSERKSCYAGVTVCEEWHSFSAFRQWMRMQKWRGRHLDKDILKPGNKVYGPKTCAFVLPATNTSLSGIGGSGIQVVGEKIYAVIQVGGRRVSLGRCATREEATARYRVAKREWVLRLASQELDPRVRAAIGRIADRI